MWVFCIGKLKGSVGFLVSSVILFSRFDICVFALDLLLGLCLCSCWRLVCVWFKLILCWFLEKMRKSGFEVILYIWVLWFEKIWDFWFEKI